MKHLLKRHRVKQKLRRGAGLFVRKRPGKTCEAIVALGPLRFRASLGRGGITAFKREGDGATPLAVMRVIGGFRGIRIGDAGRAGARLPVARCEQGWCDEPRHGAYNRPVTLPFPGSHETLIRSDPLYDLVVVLDWNIGRRARGLGSAIFLHAARPGYLPTEGCVALRPRDLRRVVGPLLSGGHVTVCR